MQFVTARPSASMAARPKGVSIDSSLLRPRPRHAGRRLQMRDESGLKRRISGSRPALGRLLSGNFYSAQRQNSASSAAVRWNGPLCGDFNGLNLAYTCSHWQAVLAQPFKVKGYGLTHFELDFCNGCPGSHAPGQIRRIRRVIPPYFFNNDCIAHSTSPESSLFKYAVQSTRRQIVAGFSGNSDATRPARVLELPMTPSWRDQIPTIALKQSEVFDDFHDQRIAGT